MRSRKPAATDRFRWHPDLGTPGTFSEPDLHARGMLRRGVRGRAIDVLLGCFADAIEAETATLLGSSAPGGLPRVHAAWDRHGREVAPSAAAISLVARAIEANAGIVEREGGPTRGGAINAVVAPVRSQDRIFGALHAEFPAQADLPPGDVRWTTMVYAGLAALCLEGDATLPGVMGASGLDPLTGCLTHAQVIEALRAELERSRRRSHVVSCCLIELDDLGSVSDWRIHRERNLVLASLGSALRQVARSYDSVGRLAGDEFLVVLPDTSTRAAGAVGKRLRAGAKSAIAATTSAPFDVSVGIATWDGTAADVELLAGAESALFHAKQDGGIASAAPRSRGGPGNLLHRMRKRRRVRSAPADHALSNGAGARRTGFGERSPQEMQRIALDTMQWNGR